MSRVERIDQFLKKMASYAFYNPELFVDGNHEPSKIVYRFLTRIDIPEIYQSYDMSNIFAKLSFLNRKHKRVKHFDYVNADGSPGTYFWPFANKEEEILNRDVPVKIYIPVGPEKLERVVQLILDFIDKKDISVNGKVGKHIRFDNIVLRVRDKQDAFKIQEFIDKNKFIRESILQPSPFALTCDNIAYGGDMNYGGVSYNACISKIISKYIISKKRHNKLNDANVYDFIEFVKKYYNDTFVNGLNEEVKNKPSDTILSEAFGIEQLLMAMNPEKGINDYFDYLEKMNDINYRNKILNQVRNSSLENDIKKYEPKLKELIIKLSNNFRFRGNPSEIIFYIKSHYDNVIPANLVDAIIRYRTKSSDEGYYVSSVIEGYKNRKMAIERAVLENSRKYGSSDIASMLMGLDGYGYDYNHNLVQLSGPFYNAVTRENDARNIVREHIHANGECGETIKFMLIQEGYDVSQIDDIYSAYAEIVKQRYNIR